MGSRVLIIAIATLAFACDRGGAAVGAANSAPASAPAAEQRPAHARVVQVVFVDQQDCCDCTKKRIEQSWAALQGAVGSDGNIEVERIHLDTQPELAAHYTKLKPLMVPPGIYFMADGGAIVDVLQGEVTREQILAVLR